MSLETGAVVVGVDATTGGKRGVRYAALEAARRQLPLTIVHVSPGESDDLTSPVTPYGTLRGYGLELLDGACGLAHEVAPDLRVESRLVPGLDTVTGLTRCSEHAPLLVLGAERRSFVGQVWTGDVVAGVAARAHCPVVVVPVEWEPGAGPGPVVVGIKDPERSGELVEAGLTEAEELGAELVLVHAWRAPSGYDDIIATRAYTHEYNAGVSAAIEPLVEARRRAHGDVPVRIESLHAQPAWALLKASEGAARLLIGRPRHGGTVHHLGGVGRALLRDAHCPVEVRPGSER
jgi:nucleotide-binding universal stress UspA family protein